MELAGIHPAADPDQSGHENLKQAKHGGDPGKSRLRDQHPDQDIGRGPCDVRQPYDPCQAQDCARVSHHEHPSGAQGPQDIADIPLYGGDTGIIQDNLNEQKQDQDEKTRRKIQVEGCDL